jgi:hypothetical protein
MLFLLNSVVLKVGDIVDLPGGMAALRQTPPLGVLAAGAEIYARHPRVEHDRPDIAQPYCSLLSVKFPGATGAYFARGATGAYTGRLAEITFPLLARLYQLQRDGVPLETEVWHTVWGPSAQAALA